MHPVNWTREDPKSMLEAAKENTVGYAVFDRNNNQLKEINLRVPANLTIQQQELRKAAQKIESLKKLWVHSIKLNTGRDYE